MALALIFLALSGCSSVPSDDDPDPGGAAQEAGQDVGIRAVRAALGMVGVPYRYGGSAPDGFDCSGLVQYSYAQAGRRLPRSVEAQAAVSRPVARAGMRPGDLLIFHLDGARFSHVALYVGNGRFVHAPSTGKSVSTARLSTPYWRQNLAEVRRPFLD